MKTRLLLILGVLSCLPLAHSASQGVQARFEQSLHAARSLTNVEIEVLDTLSITDPKFFQLTKRSNQEYSRTFQYSYTASGLKYRATCKAISGTESNLKTHSKSTFDGTWYSTYDDDNHYMTRGRERPEGERGQSALNPLIGPFMFLSEQSDDCKSCALRFTDVASREFTDGLILPKAQMSNGLFEISMPGPVLMKQPVTWRILIDEAGDAFTPKTVTKVAVGREVVYRLLNYTNLGTYHFPTRIEWVSSVYPPTSPPTLSSTGVVTVISARIPDQIADSTFNLDEEQKLAATVWSRNEKNFTKSSGENTKPKASVPPRANIYDESSDGSKQIAAALDIAKKENKRLLLQFGANWCGWCHKLHKLFDSDDNIAAELKNNYVVVMIDVHNGHNKDIDTKYGHPTRFGLPVIVILDAEGKQLTTQETGKLEEGDHHDPKKVMTFLKEWTPKK